MNIFTLNKAFENGVIKEVDVNTYYPRTDVVIGTDGRQYNKGVWVNTKEEALIEVEKRREEMIKSLQVEMLRVAKLQFTVEPIIK